MTQEQPTRNVLIFTSPKAGTGVGVERVATLAQTLRSQGVAVSQSADICDLQRLERDDSASRPDVIVAAGGDGTLSLVAKTTAPETVIAPMPLGTENLVSKHFGITSEVGSMCDMLLRGRTLAIDAGVANGKLFLVMMTCGFDAEVVRAMHLTRRGHISRFSYFWPTIRAMRRYRFPPLNIRLADDPAADQVLVCRWAMVFNLPRYAAHLDIEPAAVGDDGLLNLCALQHGSILGGLRYLAGIVAKRHSHWQDVVRRPLTCCTISSPSPVAYQIDGDYGGKLPVTVGLLPGRVRLKLPAIPPPSSQNCS